MDPSRRQFLTTCAAACGAACAGLGLAAPAYGLSASTITNLGRNWKVTELTMQLFAPHVGEVFKASIAEKSFSLTLSGVHPLVQKRPSPVKIEGFALTFTGPAEAVLPQDIYSFEHPALGSFALFAVPVVSPNPAERRYEAIISRMVS